MIVKLFGCKVFSRKKLFIVQKKEEVTRREVVLNTDIYIVYLQNTVEAM